MRIGSAPYRPGRTGCGSRFGPAKRTFRIARGTDRTEPASREQWIRGKAKLEDGVVVDHARYRDEGYLIIRGMLAGDELERTRAQFEQMFARQRDLGGPAWEKSSQRRVDVPRVVD